MAGSDPWSIVVLAAGEGRRMGGPKAIMLAAGQPWWRVQEERLGASGLPRLWVVSEEVGETMGECSSRLVVIEPRAPMFSSVRAGVEAAPSGPGVFILPVDLPAPGPEVFCALSAAAGSGVAVPVFAGKRGHPVALSRAWINGTFRPACARGKGLRLDRLIEASVREVHVEDAAVVVNLNTPSELDQWLAMA